MSTMGTRLRSSVPATTRLRIIWATMLALTTMSSLAVLLTTPFSADEGEFIHALRSGEIQSVALGHSADFRSTSGFSTTAFNAQDDIAVSWVNRFGFRRMAVLDQLQGLSQSTKSTPAASQPDARLDPSASIVRTAQSLGALAPTVASPGTLRFDRVKWLSVLVTLLMIGTLIYGPQPRRMTKWGAFWAYLIPFSVGIFYALLRDSPWNPRMNRLAEPARKDRVVVDPGTNEMIPRLGGWAMFFWSALIASLAISLVLLGVASALPTYLDPVAWTAIDLAGHPLTP